MKKLSFVVKYNKYMKGVARSHQYLSYLSVLRKTVRWSEKVVLPLLNCVVFNAFFCVNNFIPKSKCIIQNIKYCLLIATEPGSDNFQHPARRPVVIWIPNRTC
jgi:hypothetical protein